MTRMIATLAALLGLAVSTATAADPPRLEGDWEGNLSVNGSDLRIVFHVKKADDGKLSATMDSPDQGAIGLPVDTASLEGNAVTLGLKRFEGGFEGKFSADGAKIDGEWRQGAFRAPLTLSRTKSVTGTAAKPDQIWEGKLKVGAGIELRLVLNLFKQKDGGLTGMLDSLDQGVNGIKVDAVSLDKTTLTFTSKAIGGEFAGKLNGAGNEADGEWKQLGNGMPLTLTRTEKVTEARRPQVPKRPLPYREVEVHFPNKGADISIAGTLTLPEGDGPFPAVILISGSGPQDRDETLLGHKPFLVLADSLTRRGIAVLRADDRGVGGSSGNHTRATSADFATDVEAEIDYLKSRKEIDPARIGLMGHSEGGLIGPMVAARRPEDVAFLVLLAGPGVPGNEILSAQSALILKAMGLNDETIARQGENARKVYDVLRNEKDEEAAMRIITAMIKESLDAMPEAERKLLGTNRTDANLKMIRTPWFRYFLTYDPRPALAKVRCPVLAVNGEKDLQVPPKQNLPEIEKALKSGGNTRVTVREFPGLNHLFQACKTGAPSEYSQIEETFNPEALRVIGDWIEGLK